MFTMLAHLVVPTYLPFLYDSFLCAGVEEIIHKDMQIYMELNT